MAVNRYYRQSGIIDIKSLRDNEITIIGCGAIGSFVATSLAKMGLTKFSLYDFDKIELHNLPNQFFREKDIGKFKVDVTEELMKEFNDECVITKHKKYNGKKLNSSIVVSCVDDMEVRKKIFDNCKSKLFIDTRMGGLQGQVYVVDMSKKDRIKKYKETLFGQGEASQLRCTERSIIFTVLGIASLVCNQIVKAFKGEEVSNYLVLDYKLPQMF